MYSCEFHFFLIYPLICRTGEELGSRGLDAQRLRDENRELEKHEAELDFLISDVANALKLAKEDPTDKPYRYIVSANVLKKGATDSRRDSHP